MDFFWFSWVMMEYLVTSEPVPWVVGTATTGKAEGTLFTPKTSSTLLPEHSWLLLLLQNPVHCRHPLPAQRQAQTLFVLASSLLRALLLPLGWGNLVK